MKMKTHNVIIPALTAAVILAAGAVSAQTTNNPVGVSVTPATGTLSPGTGVTIGTLNFTSDATGASVASFPLALSATGGGSVGNLSNCRLYDSGGSALTGAINPVAGSNSFTFNSAMNVSQSAGTSTVSLRCDIASGTPTGTSFQITPGAVNFTTGLRVNLDVAPSVPAGSTNVALANIILDGTRSGGAVSISAIPVSVTPGNGAQVGHLSNCRIRPSMSTDGALTSTMILGGNQTFTLSSPYATAAGLQNSIAIACDVAANAPVGGTFAIGITPSAITATNVSTGGTVTPTSGTTSGTVIVTATVGGNGGDTGGTDDDGTPGVPNTGLGGTAAMTLGVLLLSALVALGGTALLRRRA